jgi:hypothetical protein
MMCRGFEWCSLAASAEAHREINRLKAKTQRMAFAPIDRPYVMRRPHRTIGRAFTISHSGGSKKRLA